MTHAFLGTGEIRVTVLVVQDVRIMCVTNRIAVAPADLDTMEIFVAKRAPYIVSIKHVLHLTDLAHAVKDITVTFVNIRVVIPANTAPTSVFVHCALLANMGRCVPTTAAVATVAHAICIMAHVFNNQPVQIHVAHAMPMVNVHHVM